MNDSLSFSGDIAIFIVFRPKKSKPNPRINWPRYLSTFFLEKKVRAKPRPIAGKAKSEILKAIIWAVMVVPILAPKITPIA